MRNEYTFRPSLRLGLAVQGLIALVLGALGGWGIYRASHANIGPVFLVTLLPAILALSLVPYFLYRAFSLQRAAYVLERDGIRLYWGLRSVQIPMNEVLWVREERELDQRIPLPWFPLPGAVLGSRRMKELGNVEFMASRFSGLILVATSDQLFAITPGDPQAFLQTYQRFTELGSITPLPAQSVYPTFLLARVWSDRFALALVLTGLAFSLVLLVWVGLAIPNRSQIFLGFDPGGNPRDLVPAVRLLLLPVLNSFLFLVDFLLGIFFYRREQSQTVAYLLWSGGAVTPLLFLIAIFFILQSG